MKATCPHCGDKGNKGAIGIGFLDGKPKRTITRNVCDACDRVCYFSRIFCGNQTPTPATREEYFQNAKGT